MSNVSIGTHRNTTQVREAQVVNPIKTETNQSSGNDSAVVKTNQTPSNNSTVNRRESANEMRNDISNSVEEAKDKPVQELNSRASNIFNTDNLNNNDTALLKTTKDDAKLAQIQDNGKVIREALKPGVEKLINELDSSVMKAGVYKKSEAFGKQFIDNLDPKSELATKILLKDDSAIKNELSKVVFGEKSKYNEPYQKAINNFQNKTNQAAELMTLRDNFYSAGPDAKPAIKKEFLQKLAAYDKNMHSQYMAQEASGNSRGLPNNIKPQEPNIYDSLPEGKRKIIDSVMTGIKSGSHPNKITSQLSISDLKPNEQQRLQGYLSASESAQATTDAKVIIPQKIDFQGKTYSYDKLLGGGGDGVAFLMKSDDNQKVVIKAGILGENGSPMYKDLVNQVFSSEAETQLGAMGDKGHENVLALKGVIKSEGALFTVTEFAKGGELAEVVDKVNKSGTDGVSPDNQKLLKLNLVKDSIQGLQHLHTEQNMTHYDIKPGNFFIGDNGQAKLADFGRSKFGHETPPGQSSDAYLAPDAKNKPGEKIDTFAMGVTMYEVLKGDNPYVGDPNNSDKKIYQKDEQLTDGKSSEDSVINAMTNPKAEDRPTLTAVLKHSTFDNPVMNNPQVKEKVGQLLEAVMSDNKSDIQKLNDELTQLTQ